MLFMLVEGLQQSKKNEIYLNKRILYLNAVFEYATNCLKLLSTIHKIKPENLISKA